MLTALSLSKGMVEGRIERQTQRPRAVTFSREPTCHGVVLPTCRDRDEDGRRAGAVGGQRKNLAFDKETAEASR